MFLLLKLCNIELKKTNLLLMKFILGILTGGGYFKQAAQGIFWMAFLRGLTRSLAVVKMIILARILMPSQFGIYGVVMIVLGLLEILTETGINIVLLQEEREVDDFISTAWLVSVTRGFLIAGVIFFSASVVADFFGVQDASRLIRFTSMVPIIRGFINPAIVKFQKQLTFSKEFWFRFSVYASDMVMTIILAMMMKSEYALIWGMILAAAIEVVISFVAVTPRPRLSFESAKIKKVVSRGKWITSAGIFEYLFQHLDDAAVGRFLGVAPLGLYQQAYRVSTLPIAEVGEVFNKVTFPTYLQIAGDKKRLKKAFLKVSIIISLLVISVGLTLFLFAKEVILILFGEKWLGAVTSLKVLAIFGIFKALANSTYPLFLAVKKQKTIMFITLVWVFGLSLPLIPLVKHFGIVGAGYAAIVGTLAGAPFVIYQLYKIFSAGKNSKDKIIY